MTKKECYTIFGMTNSISKDELKRRYRILIKRYHPDLSRRLSKKQREKNEEYCKKINKAYEILLKDGGKYYEVYDTNTTNTRYTYSYHVNEGLLDKVFTLRDIFRFCKGKISWIIILILLINPLIGVGFTCLVTIGFLIYYFKS